MLRPLPSLLLLALLGAAAAAPAKILVCGARQQGVGGEQANVLKTYPNVQRAVSLMLGLIFFF